MTRSRLLIPLAAALAVMVLTGGIWWATSGSDDNDGGTAEPAAAGPDGDQVDTPSGGGAPGNPGKDTSTDPGYGEPAAPPPDNDPAPGSVLIDSYVFNGPRSLTLNYVIGVPECYGTVTGVDVSETNRTVVLTLVHEPAEPSDDACIDIAMLKSIQVRLPSPLGDRVVKDGAYDDDVVVKRTDAPYEEGGY